MIINMKRKRILADYRPRVMNTGKKEYDYAGPMFSFSYETHSRAMFLLVCWGVPILAFLLWIAMGMISSDLSRQMYAMLPYVFLVLPIVMLLGDAYKVTLYKGALRRAEYERGFMQMRRFAIGGLCLSGVAFASSLLHMALSASFRADWPFGAGSLLLSALFFMLYRATGWVKVSIRQDAGLDKDLAIKA